MQDEFELQPIAGQPMRKCDLLDDLSLLSVPNGSRIVTIEEARKELPLAANYLHTMQALQDEAYDLTEELEILIESLAPHHPHVVEVADQLGRLVKDWQEVNNKLEKIGARIVGFEPGQIEWYGVVDGYLVLYSWCHGEEDIEWWYPLDSGISSRRPLVEA